MHDVKTILGDLDQFQAKLQAREQEINRQQLVNLDQKRRQLAQLGSDLQQLRHKLAKLLSGRGSVVIASEQLKQLNQQLVAAGLDALLEEGIATANHRHNALRCKDLTKQVQEELTSVETALHDEIATLPNLPAADLPLTAPLLVKQWGKPRPEKSLLRHFELFPKQLGLTSAAKLAGSKFSFLTGQLALLERALINFMLDQQLENQFSLVSPPLMLNSKSMYGSGHLPKFAQELFVTTTDNWLLPTAESALVNLHSDQLLSESSLPLRYVAMTPCFRSEAGAAGKDTRGIIRQHQFYKVELVAFTSPEQAAAQLEHLVTCAEQILELLGLPYQRVLLPANDLGFAAAKTYDLEVYMTGEATYREVSSCSCCGDFQARRAKIFYKNQVGKRCLVHTLNGSGLAVGRTLAALVEHYQRADGSVTIPPVLLPYMRGLTRMKDDSL